MKKDYVYFVTGGSYEGMFVLGLGELSFFFMNHYRCEVAHQAIRVIHRKHLIEIGKL